MSKAKRKKSILKQQKPQKRRSSRRRKTVFTAGFIALLALTTFGTYHLYRFGSAAFDKVIESTHAKPQSIPWVVELRPESDFELDSAIHSKMLSLAKSQLKTGSRDELSRVAKAIRKSGIFGKVGVSRTAINRVVITYRERVPLAHIQNHLFLSTDGEIYGTHAKNNLAPQHDISISGLWADLPAPKVRQDNSLFISDIVQRRVKDAVSLIEDFDRRKIQITGLEYIAFRGFEATLKAHDVKVAIGNPPFDTKLDRLEKIIGGAAEIGPDISRIELDYLGKAFVKKRKS